MDELLEEYRVSYNDLYKVHTGHYVNKESDDSDSSDDTSSLDENLKPPPFSIEEINQNVNYEAQKPTESAEKSSITSLLEEVSKKLSLLITDTYCFVCTKKRARRHYTHAIHYRNVREWLQEALANISTEVKLYNIFCEICNLVLSGNELAQNHYKSADHAQKAKKFCLPCLRLIEEVNMSGHIESKQHKLGSYLNSRVLLKSNLKILLDAQQSENNLCDINSNGESSTEAIEINSSVVYTRDGSFQDNQHLNNRISEENDSYTKSNKDMGLPFQADNGLSNPNKNKRIMDHEALADSIMDVLTPSFCYVCNMEIEPSHYYSRKHNGALELWINSSAKSFGVYLNNIDELICFACHAVFPSKRYAKIHYESSGHEKKCKIFCNVCRYIVGPHGDHYLTPEHITQETENDTKRKMVAGANRSINVTYREMYITPNKSNSLKIHGIDSNVIKAIRRDDVDTTASCNPLAKSVIELMTPVYCFICNKSALRHNKREFKHYKYVAHITELKKLLPPKGKNFGPDQINYESVYCEVCNELFLNDKLATQHYNTPQHKGSCVLCTAYGSNMHVVKSPVIQPNLLISSNGITKNRLTDVRKQEICRITNDSEHDVEPTSDCNSNDSLEITENCLDLPIRDQPGIILAEKLKDMISPTYCFICKKKVNMHIFNHHYLERTHTIKLRNWLDMEIRKSGAKIDKNILCCEDCSMELGGTDEDLKHYESVSHQLNKNKYCSICIFRGTANDVLQHNSTKQHKDNLLKLQNSSIKENKQHTSWPKKLTKLITLRECKICCVKLATTKEADFHYCSDQHNINVQKWLDGYYQFGDNSVTNNVNMFNCTFCDSSFTAEQELNDHKNSHFPSLGGTTGYRSRQSPRPRTKNETTPKTQKPRKDELEEVAIDKQIISSQTRESQSVPLKMQPHKNHSHENEDNTKCYQEIRTEINKLINTVYFLKPLPLEQSLRHLKDLNQKLLSFKSSDVQKKKPLETLEKSSVDNDTTSKMESTNTWDIQEIIRSRPSTSHNNELEILNVAPTCVTKVTKQEYSKTKLTMEIRRLNLVLGNESKIPTRLALKFAQNLNQLVEDLVKSGSREFDINDVFQDIEKTIIELSSTSTTQGDLQDELDQLSSILQNAQKVDVEIALDFITQFNVQLESLLQYQ